MGKGRGNSSAITTNEAVRLNVTSLVKNRLFVDGMSIESNISWSNGANINLVTSCQNHEKQVKLKYSYNGSLKEYVVKIEEIPSNLGKGSIKYFICPETGKKCKTLYCCYNSDVFKSRTAYSNRIYYFIQTISKEYRTASRFNKTDKQVDTLITSLRHKSYKGKPTKRYIHLQKLIKKRNYLEEKKQEEFDRYLHKYLGLDYMP